MNENQNCYDVLIENLKRWAVNVPDVRADRKAARWVRQALQSYQVKP